jgi:hypothetical protein
MERKQVKKLTATLLIAVVLFGLASPVMGIDHPVEPFQKAKALALREGVPQDGKSGRMYILMIEGWGTIIYVTERESIMLNKGTLIDNSQVMYDGKYGNYSVGRVTKGGKPEMTIVDWSVAMDIANKYLREIEAARGSK